MCLLEALGSTYRGKWGIGRFVGTPRWRIFMGWYVPPTTPAPGTKRCRPCASCRPWGALTWANEVLAGLLGLPDEEFFIGWYVTTTTLAPGTKRFRSCASWRPCGALTEENGVTVDFLGLYLYAWTILPGIICPGWTAWSARDDLHDQLGTICMIYLMCMTLYNKLLNVARIMGPWWSHIVLWMPWVVFKNIWRLLRAKTGYSSSYI